MPFEYTQPAVPTPPPQPQSSRSGPTLFEVRDEYLPNLALRVTKNYFEGRPVALEDHARADRRLPHRRAHLPHVHTSQARYAQLSAILRLRLGEIEDALARNEADRQNWDRPEMLLDVDRVLAEALVLITRRPDQTALR